MQLAFLCDELETKFPNVLFVLKNGSSMTEATQAEVKNQQPPKRNPARSKQLKPLPEQPEKDCKKDSTQASQKQTGTETEAEPMLQEVNPDRQT